MRPGHVARAVREREMRGGRPLSFGSDDYWADYRVSHRSIGTSGVIAFNWKCEHGTLLAVGSRDAYALNIVSLERASLSSTVWGSWAPFKRDADAARIRSICMPHVLAVEANAHSNWINDIMFTQDDTELLSASDDGTVIVYDVQRGKKRSVLEVPENRMVRGLCTAALEKDVLFVAADRIVLAWDRRTKASGLTFSGHSGRVSDVECSSDGRMIWSTSLDGTLRSWDARKTTCLTSLGNRSMPLASVCLDRTESQLLISAERGPAYLFDLLDSGAFPHGASLASLPTVKAFSGHSNRHYLKRARFSPCGGYVMCGSDDKRVYVWSINTGRAHFFELPDVRLTSLVDATFSHDSRQPLIGVASEEGVFVYSSALALNQPATTPTAAVPTVTPHEIKFSVEGTPVDDDFVEVNDNNPEEEEEGEEELEEELGDLVREPGVCKYDKGYTTMHVFVCRTCSHSSEPHTSAGMCYECRVDCHADHDTVSIGKKKNFRCDCGTDKYPSTPCLLRAGKHTNERNRYTHNFDLLYCFCNQPDNGELMLQCFECLEWFHHGCLQIPNLATVTEGLDFLCDSCIAATFSFLREYPTGDLSTRSPASATTHLQPVGALGYRATAGRFLEAEWRDALGPEHARIVAQHEQLENKQLPTHNGAAVVPPPPVAPSPPAAAAAAPLFEPRTKEQLDAEARRLIQMGDREGARNLVMRAFLSNTLSLLSSSRRRTVTVQDVTRAAQNMQAAPANTAINTAELPVEEVPPSPHAAAAPLASAVSTAHPGEKHPRSDEVPAPTTAASPGERDNERPAKVARHPDDDQVPPPAPVPRVSSPTPAIAATPSTIPTSETTNAIRTSNPSSIFSPARIAPAPLSPPAPSAPAPAPSALAPELATSTASNALPASSFSGAAAPGSVPEDMDAAPEENAEEQPPAEAMVSEPEPAPKPAAPKTLLPEPELEMGDAPVAQETELEESEELMPDSTPLPTLPAVVSSSTTTSSAVATSDASLVAMVDANQAVADDMERRLAEIVQDSGV